MTVQALMDALQLNAFHLADPDRPVTGGYCGDLLSWVMGNAGADHAWLTIMSNTNVAAVAALCDVACVILTESVKPDDALLARAKTQDITLLGTSLSTFEAAAKVAALLH